MKKLSILLLILMLVASLFTLVGCQKSVDLTGKVTVEEEYVGTSSSGRAEFKLTCNVNPNVLDLRNATKIVAKIRGKEYTASLPKFLNGTSDHNYFIIDYTHPTPLYTQVWNFNVALDECTAYVSGDSATEKAPVVNQEPRPEDELPIWAVIAIGVGLLVVGPLLHIVGIKIGVEIFEKPALAFVPHFIGIFLSVGILIGFGWLRALIMFAFYIAYFIVERVLDEKLGYDIEYF